MSYAEAKARYAAIGVDTDAAIARLKTVPISLHCWQGDDVRGFDTDPTKPLTGGIQTTGNYPGRARTPEELMADMDKVLSLCPGTKKINLHASYAIFDEETPWVDRDRLDLRGEEDLMDIFRILIYISATAMTQAIFEEDSGPARARLCAQLDILRRGTAAPSATKT